MPRGVHGLWEGVKPSEEIDQFPHFVRCPPYFVELPSSLSVPLSPR